MHTISWGMMPCCLMSLQVKAMNAIIDEAEDAELEDVDADTRRFLSETAVAAQNVSAQPWKVGAAGKQVPAAYAPA